jgi:lipoate-protein ligase A
MNWQLISYKEFTGRYNMDFDLQMVKNSEVQNPILRFYGWQPYCISIGANQSFNDINQSLAAKNNIEIVKRPTGGRAILHAGELTYSVIMPNSSEISGKELYKNISNSIVHGLKYFSPKLNDVELENSNPNFAELLKESSGSLCFASTAKSEIKFNGKKLVGSAQRKLGSTILQHGSILINDYHQNLVNYLNISDSEKEKLSREITNKTIEISSIIHDEVNILQLQENIISGFEKVFSANFLVNELETVSY